MMRTIIKLLIITMLVTSCQKIRDDLLSQSNSKMYFQSILCPDSSVRVIVGQTVGIHDNLNAPVNDAIVLVFINNVFVDTLLFVENGIYESGIKPVANDTVRIEVLSNTQKMTGETIIPGEAYITDINYACSTFYDALNQIYHGTLTFSLEDDPATENFYEILIYTKQQLPDGNYRYNYYVDNYSIYKPDYIIQNEGDWEFKPTTLFFSDKLFSGTTGNFTFIMGASTTYGYITLHNISKEYYYYRKFFTRHAYNAQLHSDGIRNLLFTGEPVEMYTNIQGGLGVCASYNSTTKKIEN